MFEIVGFLFLGWWIILLHLVFFLFVIFFLEISLLNCSFIFFEIFSSKISKTNDNHCLGLRLHKLQ